MPLSQYQMGMPGVSEMGQSINAIAVGLARQKYQQDILRQQMALKQAEMASQIALDRQRGALYGAQVDESNAQAGHYRAQTGQIQDQQSAAQGFGDVMGMMTQAQANPVPWDVDKLQGMAAQRAGVLAGQGRQHVPVNMAQILQAFNPRAQQAMATGSKMIANVPAGGTLMDVLNNQMMMQSPRTLNQGQTMVPGSGGPAIAQGMAPRGPASQLGQLFGPLVNLRGQGMSSGMALEPENPTFQAVDQAVRGMIPFISQQATNVSQPQIQGQVQPQAIAPEPSNALALPKDKKELKQGQKYQTSRGEATWDGEKFIK